jgi:hypothetical protein
MCSSHREYQLTPQLVKPYLQSASFKLEVQILLVITPCKDLDKYKRQGNNLAERKL